jgi:hypothetical protein
MELVVVETLVSQAVVHASLLASSLSPRLSNFFA